jgi:Transposase DDE domain
MAGAGRRRVYRRSVGSGLGAAAGPLSAGQMSVAWWDQGIRARSRPTFVEFALEDCQACPARPVCTRAQQQGRRVGLPPRAQYEARKAAQTWYGSAEGKHGFSNGPGLKGHYRRASGAAGCGAPDTGGSRKPTYSTSRPRRQSMEIGSWRGSMSAHGPKRGPPAAPRSHRRVTGTTTSHPSETSSHHLLYYKNHLHR